MRVTVDYGVSCNFRIANICVTVVYNAMIPRADYYSRCARASFLNVRIFYSTMKLESSLLKSRRENVFNRHRQIRYFIATNRM